MNMEANAPPLLSIITVCLNEPKLERTCESIVNQTFQDFEWIVVDGGSNAETLAIFEKYKKRINYFISEKDDGIYDAMNKGIKISNGVWLNFMNAGDCFYSHNTLNDVHDILKSRIDFDVIYGETISENEFGDVLTYTPKYGLMEFFLQNTICHQSVFIKRTCFLKYGYYDQKYKIASDYKFLLALHKRNIKFLRINYIIARFNRDGLSKNSEQNCIERNIIINEMYPKNEFFDLKNKEKKPEKLIANRLRRNLVLKCIRNQ